MVSGPAGSGPLRPGSGEPSLARLEAFGVAAALAALAFLLVTRYSVSPISDPARWFSFGRNFAADFASRDLAYGFPLLLAGAIEVAGPYRGFLVNIPVLVLVGAALYGFARECARPSLDGGKGGAARGALAGAVALGLFVRGDPTRLVHLANPYRDPLAFLCMLASGILVLRFASGRTRHLGAMALAGAVLAYGCSTRETSALLLAPLLLFGVLSRRRDPGLPFLRGALAFGVAFGLAAVPFLVQNQLVTGQALVPAQAAAAFREEGSLAPGIRLGSLAGTLPEVLRYLAGHYGAGAGALLAVGVVAAVPRRNLAVLALCAPAALVYALFYGAYDRAVPRYLLVVDLFALPIAGWGAGFLLDLALGRVGRPGLVGRVAVVAGFAFAVLASLSGRSATANQRVLVEGIEGFVERVREVIPEDARVLGGRPAIDVLETFLPNHAANVANLVPSRRLEDPDLPEALRRYVEEPGEVWFASRHDAARILVQREYDLVPVARIDPDHFGLERPLKGSSEILIDRVVPWWRTSVSLPLVAPEDGAHLLGVDLGHLSQLPRQAVRIRYGRTLLDQHPLDGVNFYAVDIARARARKWLRIDSDRPLPSRPDVELHPADEALTLEFSTGSGPRHRERLSDSLRERPRLPHPTLERSGTIRLPTPAPRDAIFLVDVEVGLPVLGRRYSRVIEGWVGEKRVFRGRRSVRAGDGSAERDVFTLSLTLSGREARTRETPLELRMLEGPELPETPRLSLRSVSVRRRDLADAYAIDLTRPRVPVAVTRGFLPPHPRFDRGTSRGRWTGSAASVRLFLRDAPGPAQLEVVYGLGGRPASAPPPAPEFRIRGHELEGTVRREILAGRGGEVRVTERFEIPERWRLGPAEVLEIRVTPWVPRDAGVSPDPRSLGVRIESISLARHSPVSREAALRSP